MSIKHQSQLKDKFWQEIRIEHAMEFFSDEKFGGLKESRDYLKDLGYGVGSTFINEPIGFVYGVEYVFKWKNLSKDEKMKLDGVILPNRDYEKESSLVIFFKIPRY